MERNLESVRRALKTDASGHKRDFEKMMRENVVLTRELNELRKEFHEMQLQKGAVDQATSGGFANADIPALLELLGLGQRTRTDTRASSGSLPKTKPSRSTSAQLKDGVWRELEMQNAQMKTLESDLASLCGTLGVSVSEVLSKVDGDLLAGMHSDARMASR
jgi:hypothetical protein